MSAKLHGSGLYSHVPTEATGVTAYKGGLETAASAAGGRAVTNIDDIKQDTSWRAADTDPANTRLLCRLDKRESVGAVVLAGLEEMTGKDAACRVRWDDSWIEKPAAPLVAGKTAVDIAEVASWTFVCLFRLDGAALQASTDDICEVRNHTTTSTSTTRLVQLAVGAAGNLLVRLERFGGAPNETDFTSGAQIDDGAWHLAEISFVDTGGTGGTATVYLDGTSLGILATTDLFGVPVAAVWTVAMSGNHHVAQLELWNAALTAGDLVTFRGAQRSGREIQLECGLNFGEFSGATAADVTGSHDMTLTLVSTTLNNAAAVDKSDGTVGLPSTAHGFAALGRVTIAGDVDYAGTYRVEQATTANEIVVKVSYTAKTFSGAETAVSAWETAQNPLAKYSPAAAPRWQSWRRRNVLQLQNVPAGSAVTATSLSTSPLVDVMLWIQFPGGAADTFPISVFGDSTATGSFDWDISQFSGSVRFQANRYHVSSITQLNSTTDFTDGAWHRVHCTIDWAGAMTLAVDGVEEATGTAPAYAADTLTKFTLHVGSSNYEANIAGPMLVSRRTYSHAEADAILLGTAPVFPTSSCDPEAYLLYLFREGTGTAIANDGRAGRAGDVTGSAATTWDVDGFDNPSPGALQGTLSDRVSQTFWEIAPGVDYDCLEILIELYAPGAANAPTVYSLYTYVVLWTDIGIPSGQGAGVGPPVDFSGAQVSFGGPEDTGRRLAYAFPLLSPAESANLSHFAIEARRTRRDGDTSPMRPMALIYRASDRWRWPETCAIIIPDLPRWVADGSRSTSWEYAIEIGGQEVRYGSSA